MQGQKSRTKKTNEKGINGSDGSVQLTAVPSASGWKGPRERVIRISKVNGNGERTVLKLIVKSAEKTAVHEELAKKASEFEDEDPLLEGGLIY